MEVLVAKSTLVQAFERSPVGMAFLKDGLVVSANPALLGLLKKPSQVVVGAPVDDHLRPEDRPRWVAYLNAFVDGEAADNGFESPFLPADGRQAWWSLRLSALGEEGDLSSTRRLFAVVQDETARRISEQGLTDARLAAEGASLAKSEFLANMSHEIRTPLFTITGMTDLLRLGDLKRDQAHHAGQIASAAQHLLDLVNDVLDFSKIEAGQMSLESIPIDLDEVVGRSLEVVSLSAYRKGIELVLDLDPTVPRRWLGDPSRLRQVLVNLLGNAVKFTHRGRVTLAVGPGLTFRVRDTGIGISESARQSLFRVFTQADSSTTRQYGGTGLGLVISQKLIGLLGGKIDFTSTPGEGTEFFFSIELAPDGPLPPPLETPGHGHQVLLVDNDPGVREVLGRRLEEAGFAVIAVPDRTQAHQVLMDKRPSVVLIDQELGPEDGWQLASEVRAEASTADLPLVLMSLLRKTLEPSPRYPADLFRAFIDKPVNTRSLIDVLVRGIGGQWAVASSGGVTGGLLDRASLVRSPDRLRVLVAEDHEVNRELFRLLLQNLGHEVFLVENGREACETALETKPHLVFMDLQMPVMNGYEASAALRKKGLACPIVAVTASALKGELERCQAAGMNGILTKPFNLETLDSVVRSYVPRISEISSLPSEPAVPVLPEPDTFSYDDALRVFLGNRELLVKLIEKFRHQTIASLARLDQAVSDADAPGLRAGAHALKGSAANLTALTLAKAAEVLEHDAAEAKLDDAGAQVAAIREAFEAFEEAVSEIGGEDAGELNTPGE